MKDNYASTYVTIKSTKIKVFIYMNIKYQSGATLFWWLKKGGAIAHGYRICGFKKVDDKHDEKLFQLGYFDWLAI